jgi:hypothetical protein
MVSWMSISSGIQIETYGPPPTFSGVHQSVSSSSEKPKGKGKKQKPKAESHIAKGIRA